MIPAGRWQEGPIVAATALIFHSLFFDFPTRQMYLLAKQYRNFSKWKHFAKMFIQSKCLTRVWFSVRSKIWLRLAKMKSFFFKFENLSAVKWSLSLFKLSWAFSFTRNYCFLSCKSLWFLYRFRTFSSK